MRWRGVHHCERCGQPTVREPLAESARTLLLYTRQAASARGAERLRWIHAAEQLEQSLRAELDRNARERARLADPSRADAGRPAEWRVQAFTSAPPPLEFLALEAALRSRRRLPPRAAEIPIERATKNAVERSTEIPVERSAVNLGERSAANRGERSAENPAARAGEVAGAARTLPDALRELLVFARAL